MIMKPVNQRFFEDYDEGQVLQLGPIKVEQEEVIEFARRYDPQFFHTDPERAEESIYGGLIASGWHTASLAMRLLVEGYLSSSSSIGSPGINELRWLQPVFPGDLLRVRLTVLETRISHSSPERGIVTSLVEIFNQKDLCVMSCKPVNFFLRRDVES